MGSLSDYNGLPLSYSLPVKTGHFDEETTENFFSNLLPEQEILTLLARFKKFSRNSYFDALSILGRECAGAIIITEENVLPQVNYKYIDKTDDIINFLQHNMGLLLLSCGGRLSLAGAQDKISVLIKDNRFYLHEDYSPTSHILKPDSLIFPNLVYNEAYCMNLAKELNMNTAECNVIKFENCRPILVIKRYDRNNGLRIHQEDFCQIMNISCETKYQNAGYYYGIPSIIEAAHNLGIDIRYDLLKFTLFNYFIGNMDGHAKNLSLLYHKDKSITLAPFYDLVSTTVYENLDRDMSMVFGKHYNIDLIDNEDFLLLAKDLSLSLKDVIECLDYFLTSIPIAINNLKYKYDYEIVNRINYNIKNSLIKGAQFLNSLKNSFYTMSSHT